MKKILFAFILVFMLLSFPVVKVGAHPGGTDSSGCHTCRTNCSSWGLSNGQYHCHTGESGYSSNTKTTTRKIVYGCIDAVAVNYSSSATTPDGTCKYSKEIKKERAIKYETETKGSTKHGERSVIKEGSNGVEQLIINQIVDENGREVSREIISETIINEPVNQVVEYKEIKAKDAQVPKESTFGGEVFLVVIILLIINVFYSNKNKNIKLLINDIRKLDNTLRYIMYVLYFIFIIPVFIDTIMIIVNLFQNRK